MRANEIPNLAERQVLSLPEVVQLTGLRKTAVYCQMKRGTFPRNFKVTGWKVGWLRADVNAWIARVSAARELR